MGGGRGPESVLEGVLSCTIGDSILDICLMPPEQQPSIYVYVNVVLFCFCSVVCLVFGSNVCVAFYVCVGIAFLSTTSVFFDRMSCVCRLLLMVVGILLFCV